jgi:ArsR family transcriptional regulator
MTRDPYAEEAQFFGALSHPTRLQILAQLANGEACVCHLATMLQLRQAYVSQQLAILREADLISDRKEGLYVYYGLRDEGVASVVREASKLLEVISGTVRSPTKHTTALEAECPCPQCQSKRSRAAAVANELGTDSRQGGERELGDRPLPIVVKSDR